MADIDREAARARRDEIERDIGFTHDERVHSLMRRDAADRIVARTPGLISDCRALDAALSVSEQQTAALRQDNARLFRTVNESLSFLDNGMKHAATACLRAALSVQPKEGTSE